MGGKVNPKRQQHTKNGVLIQPNRRFPKDDWGRGAPGLQDD